MTSSLSSVNILKLAASAVASTIAASRPIRSLAEASDKLRNGNGGKEILMNSTKEKDDGTLVTEADYQSQVIIVNALRSVNPDIRIVGEEEGCKNDDTVDKKASALLDTLLLEEVLEEMQLCDTHNYYADDCDGFMVEASRIGAFVDPLDGTNQYAKGNYDNVSILIGITLDDAPIFGVICKPFRQRNIIANNAHKAIESKHVGERSIKLDAQECFVLYGGSLVNGAYIYGNGGQKFLRQTMINPKAIISSSRNQGIVQDYVKALYKTGAIAKEPILVSGAGEKGLRLLIGTEDEGVWPFPRPGTSLWDVAAADAILQAVGGKLSDRNGQNIDYSSKRVGTENNGGIIAAASVELHEACVKVYRYIDDIAS